MWQCLLILIPLLIMKYLNNMEPCIWWRGGWVLVPAAQKTAEEARGSNTA